MKLRHSIRRGPMAGVFGRAAIVFIVCATFVAPAAALGLSIQAGQGEPNDQRSELEGTEHIRAGLHQIRRSVRCKFNPASNAGNLSGQVDQLLPRWRRIAAQRPFESLTDGWTSPLRL